MGGVTFTIAHAAPSDPLYQYLRPDTPDAVWTAEMADVNADVLLLGHTHVPLLRRHGSTLVVNPGSVGLPRDDDTRTQYALWEDGEVVFHRRDYDRTALVDAVSRLDLPASVIEDLLALFHGRYPGEQ